MSHENNNRVCLSPEEYAQIMNLPSRTFLIADKHKTGRFDQENGKFYLTDEQGALTGTVLTISKGKKASPSDRQNQGTNNQAAAGEHNESKSVAGKSATKGFNPNKFLPFMKNNAKPLCIGLIALIIIVSVVSQGFGDTSQPSAPSGNTNTHTNNPGPINTIEVVQAIRDLIPGDELTPEDIQTATVSAEVFSQITLSGTQIYKWERSEYLIGKYITGYVPAGQYLAYNNIAPTVTFAANPWTGAIDGTTFVKVPIDAVSKENDLLNFGTILNIEIRKETVNQVATGGDSEQTNIDGLNHSTTVEQSVTIDTYTMTDLTVCDILNSEGESIYTKYCSYKGIPAGEQLPYLVSILSENEQLKNFLEPAYILIRTTVEQAQALGDLTAEGTSVKLSISEAVDKSTDAKADFAANARSISATIQEAIAENQQPPNS